MKKIGFIIIIFGVIFIIVRVIIPNNEINTLDKYNLLDDEVIQEEFKYKDKNYVLTRYYKSDSTYSYNNILFKNNDNYYMLKRIDKCDMSYYIDNNNIYVHCIGKKGNIIKYTINNYIVSSNILEFNYDNTPNISEIHITIDKVDNKYIYLRSVVKNDDSVKEGEQVKCSFNTYNCEYY